MTKTDINTQTQATWSEKANVFDNMDVSKLFSLYDEDNNKKLTTEEQDDFLFDFEYISFIHLPESIQKKIEDDHGLSEQEFNKYSTFIGQYWNIEHEDGLTEQEYLDKHSALILEFQTVLKDLWNYCDN